MSSQIPLTELKKGCRALITGLSPKLPEYRRLVELGFCPGGELEFLFSGCLGEPRAYLIRGCVFALRRETAQNIIVTPTSQALH